MAKLDKSVVADEELLHEGEKAVCAMYGRLQEYDVYGLRHTMFGSRTTDQQTKLSPCNDACEQHIKRTNYQAAIWRHCLSARLSVPPPHGNGCTADGDIVVPSNVYLLKTVYFIPYIGK